MRRILQTLTTILLLAGCGPGSVERDATDAAEEEEAIEDVAVEDDPEPEPECTADGDCDDDDPCTSDSCSEGACTHGEVDEDGDGHPAEQVDGTDCGGTDCDDSRDDVHPDATPGCEDVDVDCDGVVENDHDSDTHVSEACGGDDCDDEDDSIHPGATEVCADGVDQDCDGVTDGPMAELADVRITSVMYDSSLPSLAWTGSEYGVAWHDVRDGTPEIYFARISEAGAKVGSDSRITLEADYSLSPSLSWASSEFGVAWHDTRDGQAEIYFARISASGSKEGSDVPITSGGDPSFEPAIAWSGSEYGVSWHTGSPSFQVYFARISASGSKVGSDTLLSGTSARCHATTLSWTGSEYAVAWSDNNDGSYSIFLARVSATGSEVGSESEIVVDTSDSKEPSLAWTGSEHGLGWSDDRDGNFEIYLARISATGSKVGSDARITVDADASLAPSLAWSGSEFAVVWHDDRDGNFEIYLARISASGSKLGGDVRITTAGEISSFPSLVPAGPAFGVCWQDYRYGRDEILYNRIGYCD